ncbi:MAG: SIS domain-containing protein [Aquabacterium sp.]
MAPVGIIAPTMLEARIQQHFFDTADQANRAADMLARPLADAAQAIVASVTSGARLWVLGLGPAAPLGPLLVDALASGHERDRPGLPALLLPVPGAARGEIGPQCARLAATLGLPGDLLLLIDADGDHPALQPAAAAAQGRDMNVVAFAGRAGSALGELLSESDVWVPLPPQGRAQTLQTLLAALYALCEAIDLELLGDEEPT